MTCGETLKYNNGRPARLHVGMSAYPVAVDLTGNGLPDIISPRIYCGALDEPWFALMFCENIGTSENPLFDRPRPMRASGLESLNDSGLDYVRAGVCIDVVCWPGSEKTEILVVRYAGDMAFGGGNTEVMRFALSGERDKDGTPILRYSGNLRLINARPFQYFRVVDWLGDGRLCFLAGEREVGRTDADYGDDPRFDYVVERRRAAAAPYKLGRIKNVVSPENARMFGSGRISMYESVGDSSGAPSFARLDRLKDVDGRELQCWGGASFDVADFDGDGDLDILMCDSDDPYPAMKLYENTGTRQEPVFVDRGKLDGFSDPVRIHARRTTCLPFGDYLVAPRSRGGNVEIWKISGREPEITPLLQKDAYINVAGGYAGVCVCDWDGDGGLDIVAGNEAGYVVLIENRGDIKKPVFEEPVVLKEAGVDLRIRAGKDGPKGHGRVGEKDLGQASPVYVDWDGDGLPDLVVGNTTEKMYFFKNIGTRSRPEFAARSEITVDGGESPPYSDRQCPGFVDHNGDGLMDMVACDIDYCLCLYERFRDSETGELKLKPGRRLKNINGEYVFPDMDDSYTWRIHVVDWDGDGDWDVLVGAAYYIFYFENVGTSVDPVFMPGRRLLKDGNVFKIGRHDTSVCAVDWRGTGKLDLVIGCEAGFVLHLNHEDVEWEELS